MAVASLTRMTVPLASDQSSSTQGLSTMQANTSGRKSLSTSVMMPAVK